MKNAPAKNSYQQHRDTYLAHIVSAIPAKSASGMHEFVRQFYAKIPLLDLEKLEPRHAAALASSAHEFIAQRDAGTPKIRIFSPQKKTDGYVSNYTVIELLNDDMPFLVDSLSAELTRQGFTLRETIHPIFHVARDARGKLVKLSAKSEETKSESFIHFEISSPADTVDAKQLERDLRWVLTHIRASVSDWRAIVKKVDDAVAQIETASKHFDKDTVSEVEDFLRWLVNRNFVFMGYAEYDFFDKNGRETLSVVPGSTLGILKIDDEETPHGLEALPPELRHFLLVPQLIEITKSNRRSLVHRPVPMDYIGLKRFNAQGKIIGEARFLGLFTSTVYYQSADMIPFVRQKIADAQKRSDFDPVSHDGKSFRAILEFLPRDEIFQMTPDDLFEVSMGILALESKPEVRLFVRKDAFERFVSLMVFVPRERFSTDLRLQIEAIVEKAFNGTVSTFSTQITEAPLVRLQLIVKTTPGNIPEVDAPAIEREIAKRAYRWADLLQEALIEKYQDARAEKWRRAYTSAFPQNYINRYDAGAAAYDIKQIEEAIASGGMVLELFRNKSEAEQFLHLKIYNPNEEIALSDILPMLENAGFRVIEEHPFFISPQGSENHVWIRDFKLEVRGSSMPIDDIKPLLEDVLLRVWRREMESDRFNALVLKAGLNARQVTLLRAYAKYLKQIAFSYSQPAIEQAFGNHPDIARAIVALFEARFDPHEKNSNIKNISQRQTIEAQLANVTNAAEDHILRRYLEIMLATLRTNYFQSDNDGAHKPVLSFKLDSAHVPELPLPRPFAEIFVYGMRVEGIHLRGGRVARGGLRWSDRPDDFRTEVLGLMKAQMVKNSVIVPVGSKGGFVVKHPPVTGGREAYLEEGIACYKLYLQGLLDITDNIIHGKVVPPAQVVRQDGDDPYLVVAADKGTATFSDIANSVSQSYGFWLGDAFASGGSAGYDHKAMAITARGAWVSVTRHFQEMGVDIGKQEFTVAGIGDMAGDVFGNGMLLSENIKLVAAFNHMHIVLDPTPDAKASFAERKRLYNLPRSSWKDYDTKLISKGGGIFERSAKTIPLSKEVQTALGITKASLTPDELIRAILLSPVDLLWNGGIGTYVKAEDESHEQVGDRANNAVRVNGRELRCKVVGEGGNLGFTQKGRIEYARLGVQGNGGRINTDAIDNSAGVDCSDHEVNIKIALSHELASGSLSLAKRNKLLVSMTEDVARLVLKDNILQTQALSITEQQGPMLLEAQERLMHSLERDGLLDRTIEFLPADKQIADLKTARKGLTRPELSVLLAYSKMALYRDLLESNLPEESYFLADLNRYFPHAMQKDYAAAIARHPLKREIIATVVTNSLVNRAGITFCSSMQEDLGASAHDVATAYTIARDAFGLRGLWNAIEQHGADIAAATQAEMYGAISRFLERVSGWLLRNLPLPLDIRRLSAEIAPEVARLEKQAASLQSDDANKDTQARIAKLTDQSVPEELAAKIVALNALSSAPDIIAVAHKNTLGVGAVGKVYFEIGQSLGLDWLRSSVQDATASSYWERLASQTLVGNLYEEQRRLTDSAITAKDGLTGWLAAHDASITRLARFIDDLRAVGSADLPKLTVALNHVRALGIAG